MRKNVLLISTIKDGWWFCATDMKNDAIAIPKCRMGVGCIYVCGESMKKTVAFCFIYPRSLLRTTHRKRRKEQKRRNSHSTLL